MNLLALQPPALLLLWTFPLLTCSAAPPSAPPGLQASGAPLRSPGQACNSLTRCAYRSHLIVPQYRHS